MTRQDEHKHLDAILALAKAEGVDPHNSERMHELLKDTVLPQANVRIYNRWLVNATVEDMK